MKIKPLVPDFIPPKYNNDSACFDIYLQEDITLTEDTNIKLGFASEFKPGKVAILLPRSSAGKMGINLRNTAGIIDADYRGEWIAMVHLLNSGVCQKSYKRGDRIFQCMVIDAPQEPIEITDNLTETTRGTGGIGSTGK